MSLINDKDVLVNNNAYLFNISLLGFFIIVISCLVGFRGENIGTDTHSYIAYYNIILNGDNSRISELFFEFIAKVAVYFSFEHEIFLSLVSFISLATYIFFITKVSKVLKFDFKYKKNLFIYFTFAISLLSFIFWNTQINVIRSGLAIPFLFLSLYYLYSLDFYRFLLFFILTVLSHLSTFIFLPFMILFYFKNSIIMWMYFILSIAYLSGLMEKAFYSLGAIFYQLEFLIYYLNNATRESTYQSGVRLDFFIFTTFFYLILFHLQKKDKEIDLIFKIYSILIYPFLFLGFINYSDRLLLAAWNLIPIIITVGLVYKIKLVKQYYLLSLFLLCCSIVGSLYYRELLTF